MSKLGSSLAALNRNTAALDKEKGTRQMVTLGTVDPAALKASYLAAARELRPLQIAALTANFGAAGLKSRTGTLLRGLRNPATFVSETSLVAKLPPGLKYSDKASKPGDAYAAAGAFRYGAVRQPIIKRKGDLYKDLPTGQFRHRKHKAGAMGDRLKRSVKEAVLKNGKIIGLGQKSRDAFERAQDQTRKKLGAPIDLGRGITVLPPRVPFFAYTGQQLSGMQERWAANLITNWRKLGIDLN